MKREELLKDFSEIYIGQNYVKLVKEYYRKKQKDLFLLAAAGIGIVIICGFNDWKNSTVEENNKMLRNEIAGEKEEILLQVKPQNEEWKEIQFELYAKEYSKKELDKKFLEACQLLPALIISEGESLENISSDLNLIDEIEEFPFLIRWESSKPELIDEEGKLLITHRDKGEDVELTAIFAYEEWEWQHKLNIHVVSCEADDFIFLLEENLKEQEISTRKKINFYLPEDFQGVSLQWRYPRENSAIIMAILFGILIPVISFQKDREIHKQVLQRKQELQNSFPEFIAKLVLLLEAGLSIKSAMFQIVEDYQKKAEKKKTYLYEELFYICRQMKNGLSEKEGYELLAKRCGLVCYTKISGMLIQHLQKGGNSILYELRNESLKASEEQKRNLQKKGEEMGTKLLFPMMIMLGIVMVFIMVPALFSFQI